MKVSLYSSFRSDVLDGASVSGRNLVQALRGRQIDVIVYATDLGWTKECIDAHSERTMTF